MTSNRSNTVDISGSNPTPIVGKKAPKERLVVSEPRGPGSVAFTLIPRERLVNRRQRPDPNACGAQHGAGTTATVGGDRQLARFRQRNLLDLEIGERGCGGPLRSVGDEVDKFVG